MMRTMIRMVVVAAVLCISLLCVIHDSQSPLSSIQLVMAEIENVAVSDKTKEECEDGSKDAIKKAEATGKEDKAETAGEEEEVGEEEENFDDGVGAQQFKLLINNFANKPLELYWEERAGGNIKDAVHIATIKAQSLQSINTFNGHNFFLKQKDLFAKSNGKVSFIASPANTNVYITPNGELTFTDPDASSQGKKGNKRFVEPTSTGMGAKFRNLSNKTVKKWYVPEYGEKVFQGVYRPGEEGTSATYHGHVFSFTDKNDDSKELIRFTMNPDEVLYAYVDEATADPEDLKRHKEEVAFSEEYKKKTGRHWIAYYPKGPAQTYIWPADHIGQKHTVTSKYGLKHSMDEDPKEETFTIEVLSTEPRAYLIRNFFSHEEADHLIALGEGKYKRSSVGGSKADGDYGMKSNTRTSRNTWLSRDSSPMTENMYRRVADLTKVEPERLLNSNNYVEFQLVSYEKGQEYGAHHDWGVERGPATRFLTLLLYLNDKASPDAGGETQFPKARVGNPDGLTVHAGKGNAILFYNQLPDGNVDDFALHAALPVRKGKKFLANFWIWDKFYGGVFEKRSKKH